MAGPEWDRDLSLCGLAPPPPLYFCTDTDWCFARLVLRTLVLAVSTHHHNIVGPFIQNRTKYNAIVQHTLKQVLQTCKTLALS